MKRTISLMKKLSIPIILLAVAIYLYSDAYIITLPDMIESMIVLNDDTKWEDNEFNNIMLGANFSTPDYGDAVWETLRYQDSFTSRPRNVSKASTSEFMRLMNSKGWYVFEFKATYMDFRYSINRRESSEKLAKRLRNNYVHERSSALRENYKDSYAISEPVSVYKNGYTLYKFTSHQLHKDEYFISYVIRVGDFAYAFNFYGWGEEVDQVLIDGILQTIDFSIPEFEILENYKK